MRGDSLYILDVTVHDVSGSTPPTITWLSSPPTWQPITVTVRSHLMARSFRRLHTNRGYVFTPLLVNALATGTTTTQHLMFIAGADIEILSTGAARSTELVNTLAALDQDRRTALISGSIKPGGSQGAAFNVIDSQQTQTINTFLSPGEEVDVVTRVSVKATVDGSDITGKPFDYPLHLCRGCLLVDLGPCAGLAVGFVGFSGGVCNLLQDGTLECCDNFAVCPARGPVD